MEIELQYRYSGDKPPLVPTELGHLPLAGSESVVMTDSYFDTEQLSLRSARCALRVRTVDNRAGAELTWKGPSRRGRRAGKKRTELELPIDVFPAEGVELEALLRKHGLWKLVRECAGLPDEFRLSSIGRIRTERSRHTYADGLHVLELSWDRVQYPVGPDETRLELEVKSDPAERYLADADAFLRELFAPDLQPVERGKVRELCERLYPELVAA